MLAAVAVMPSSTVVQIATSAVLKRNSPLKSLRVWTKGVRMMVAVLPLFCDIMISLALFISCVARMGKILQSSKTKNRNHQNLRLLLHLQFPHNEERQKSKGPVRNGIQHRDNISQNHDDIGTDAFAMMIRIEIPPERDGSTLEGDQ